MVEKFDADTIKRIRKSKGWSRSDLAKMARLSVRTIERAESGNHAVSDQTRGSIAQALGLTDEFDRPLTQRDIEQPVRVSFTIEIPANKPDITSSIITAVLKTLNANERKQLSYAIVNGLG